MKRIAMIKEGVVDNIAAWDGESDWTPDGYELIDVTDQIPSVDIGDIYDAATETFSKPKEGEPS